MRLFFLAIVLSMATCVNPAYARTFNIDIIQVGGFYAMPRQSVIAAFGITRDRFAKIGILVKLRRVSSVPAQGPRVDLTTWMRQGWYWQMKLLHKGAKKIYYVALPPFSDGWKRYIAGQSFICSVRRLPSIAVGNAQMFNQDGVLRFYESAVVMTHELGHSFGAHHEDSASLMNPAATILPGVDKLQFSVTSAYQINKCSGGIK